MLPWHSLTLSLKRNADSRQRKADSVYCKAQTVEIETPSTAANSTQQQRAKPRAWVVHADPHIDSTAEIDLAQVEQHGKAPASSDQKHLKVNGAPLGALRLQEYLQQCRSGQWYQVGTVR